MMDQSLAISFLDGVFGKHKKVFRGKGNVYYPEGDNLLRVHFGNGNYLPAVSVTLASRCCIIVEIDHTEADSGGGRRVTVVDYEKIAGFSMFFADKEIPLTKEHQEGNECE